MEPRSISPPTRFSLALGSIVPIPTSPFELIDSPVLGPAFKITLPLALPSESAQTTASTGFESEEAEPRFESESVLPLSNIIAVPAPLSFIFPATVRVCGVEVVPMPTL